MTGILLAICVGLYEKLDFFRPDVPSRPLHPRGTMKLILCLLPLALATPAAASRWQGTFSNSRWNGNDYVVVQGPYAVTMTTHLTRNGDIRGRLRCRDCPDPPRNVRVRLWCTTPYQYPEASIGRFCTFYGDYPRATCFNNLEGFILCSALHGQDYDVKLRQVQ